MKRTFWLSIAAYFVITMSVAYPWHMLIFHEKYLAMGAFTRGQPIMPFGMLSIVLQGAVFAYFFPLYYRHKGGGSPVRRGLEFGLFLGLTVYTVMVFATAAKFQIEPVLDFVLLGTGFQLIQFALVGMTIGWIHGFRSAREQADRSLEVSSFTAPLSPMARPGDSRRPSSDPARSRGSLAP